MSTKAIDQWIEHIQQTLDERRFFLAYDLSLEALEAFPDHLTIRLLGVLALVNSGAINKAQAALHPIAEQVISVEMQSKKLLAGIQSQWPRYLESNSGIEAPQTLINSLNAFARDIVRLGSMSYQDVGDQCQALNLLGAIYLRIWQQEKQPDQLKLSYDYYSELFWLSHDAQSGINAALLAYFSGQFDKSKQLAAEVLEIVGKGIQDAQTDLQLQTIAAEAHLLLGHATTAETHFAQATQSKQANYSWRVAELYRLRLMLEYQVPVSQAIFTQFEPPVTVIFAGHPIDSLSTQDACFPPDLEPQVKKSIQIQLAEMNAEIGYCAAGAGSDILFIEAMLERDAEVNIVLPCHLEDYIEQRVAYAGRNWERRCRNAIQLAASVTYATEERLLGHQNLFRFNNVMIEGLARIHADLLLTEPQLLVVWDALADHVAGGGADFMDQWADIKTLHLIHLDELRTVQPPSSTEKQPPRQNQALSRSTSVEQLSPWKLQPEVAQERIVKAMLFVDIVGFSKLEEAYLPKLWPFLAEIQKKAGLDNTDSLDLIESWGDALYVVSGSARAILRLALALKKGFDEQNVQTCGIPVSLNIRVGLHAGPVFEGTHPFTGKPIVYGSHVSRAARIEPITVPGEIYASQQFVAMLSVEEQAIKNECSMTQQPYSTWFHCEYVGTLLLAKQYGSQPIYHISG